MILVAILLLITSVIDYKHHIIPNTSSILLFFLSLYLAYSNGYPLKIPCILAVYSYILLLLIVVITEKIAKQYVMGGGDIKLLSALTGCIGIKQMTTVMLLLSIMLFLVYCFKKDKEPIALCPLIFIGYLLSFIF